MRVQIKIYRCGIELDCDGVIATPPPNSTTPPPVQVVEVAFPLAEVLKITGVVVGVSVAVVVATLIAAFFLR